jgi:hypothetical protein
MGLLTITPRSLVDEQPAKPKTKTTVANDKIFMGAQIMPPSFRGQAQARFNDGLV